MVNAKEELLAVLSRHGLDTRAIRAADIILDPYSYGPVLLERPVVLKLPLDDTGIVRNLDVLDVEYDDDFGTQYLDGTVWLTDGAWLQRGEYDGSEWWEYCRYPVIPVDLIL
jgi:hypothetical protein